MRNPVTSCIIAAAVIAAVACGSDRVTNPSSDRETALDLTAILAAVSGAAAGNFRGAPVGPLPAGSPVPTPWIPADCPYSDVARGFICPTISVAGMTIAHSFFLYDAAGASLARPDAKTTASVRTITDVSGTLPPPPVPGFSSVTTLSRHEDMTLSGLLTGKLMLNGTEMTRSDGTLTGNGTTLHTVVDETGHTTNIVLPPLDGSSRWPQSGSITIDQTIAIAAGTQPAITTTLREVMTFNGTSVVTVTITRGTITSTCTFDLANPGALPSCTT